VYTASSASVGSSNTTTGGSASGARARATFLCKVLE
jgi:hypothetical protein